MSNLFLKICCFHFYFYFLSFSQSKVTMFLTFVLCTSGYALVSVELPEGIISTCCLLDRCVVYWNK